MKYKLSDVVDRINGNVDRFTTSLEYYVGGEHFESNELEITGCGLIKPNVNILGFKFHFAFQPGDVLYMARNPHLRKAGMVNFSGICSDASYILRTKDSNVLCQEYLAVIMQSNHLWDYCESHKVGSVNFAINWKTLANYEFDLPDINIQRSIANRIWAAYRVKQAYKKLISATDEMVKSRFIEWFGNPFLSPKNGKSVSITDVADIVLGTTPNSKIKEYWDGELKWITPAEIEEESFIISDTVRHITEDGRNSANLTLLPVGSVLFSTRAPIGKVAIAGEEMYCNQGFKNFICKPELNNVFLYYTLRLNKEYLVSLGTGTTFKELSKKIVESIKISVPAKEQQEQFETLYRQADKSKFDGFKSRFIEWFGDMKYLTSDKTMSDFFDMKAGQSITAEDIIATYDLELFPCYGGNGLRGYVTHYTHEGHYCLIGRQGALCGNVNLTDGKFFATEHAIVVTPKININTYWLFFALSEMNLNRFARGVAQPGLSVKQLETIPFSIPPTEEQDSFERLYRQADKSKYYKLN